MAGIKEIAKITGLSVATVSRVFNNDIVVSAKTRQKVLKVAKELDYQPNIMAAALRSGRNNIIGVLVPELNNPFFAAIINGIEKKARASGYSIIIAQSHDVQEHENTALQSFLKLKVEGILISISQETIASPLLEKTHQGPTPIAFFDRLPNLPLVGSVTLNDYKGAVMATEHLLERGCTNIIHICGDPKISIFNERKRGFVETMQKHSEKATHLVLHLTSTAGADTDTLKKVMAEMPKIDGFFCYGDEMALHVLQLLQNLNHRVPEDIKLIGFGNADFSELVQPKLSSIDQKCDEMGSLVAEMLLQSIKSKKLPQISKKLTPKLVVRESTT